MRRDPTRAWRWLAAGGLTALLAATAAGDGGRGELDPGRLRWSELHYRARKLLFSAEVRVRAEVVATAAAAARLEAVPGHSGLSPGGGQVVRLELESSLLGRRTLTAALLEPGSAAALQTETRESGRRARLKTQRFGSEGVAIARRRPADGEATLPEQRWSRHSLEVVALPPPAAGAAAVSDPLALFWVLATAPLERVGDSWQLRLLSDGRLLAVTARVVGRVQRTLVVGERRGAVKRRIEQPVVALELSVDAEPVVPDDPGAELEFLGLQGDVRIVLDPARRVPIEVSGRVPGAGAVVVRLQDLILHE